MVEKEETTPIFVYTNYNSANVYKWQESRNSKNEDTKLNRYRLMWMDVKYTPGTVKVIAYNDIGEAARKMICNRENPIT